MARGMPAIDVDRIRSSIRRPVIEEPRRPAVEVLPPPRPPESAEEYQEAIGTLWRRAQASFVEIGRHLEEAERRLDPAAYAEMCRGLPFDRSARSQLLGAYRLVRSGALPAGVEAAGYATVYLAATLTEQERGAAIAEGIIGPGMSRRAIVEFKRRVRAAAQPEPDVSPADAERRERLVGGLDALLAERQARLKALLAECRRVDEERRRLDAERRRLLEEIAEIQHGEADHG